MVQRSKMDLKQLITSPQQQILSPIMHGINDIKSDLNIKESQLKGDVHSVVDELIGWKHSYCQE